MIQVDSDNNNMEESSMIKEKVINNPKLLGVGAIKYLRGVK